MLERENYQNKKYYWVFYNKQSDRFKYDFNLFLFEDILYLIRYVSSSTSLQLYW